MSKDVPLIPHWIDGQRVESAGNNAPVYNPATGEVQSHVALADEALVQKAIESARAGYEAWSETSMAKRQNVIFKFRELLNERKSELAKIITAEHGKVLTDAAGEVCGSPMIGEASAIRGSDARGTEALRPGVP